jgi:hypothetical protein
MDKESLLLQKFSSSMSLACRIDVGKIRLVCFEFESFARVEAVMAVFSEDFVDVIGFEIFRVRIVVITTSRPPCIRTSG